MIGHNRYLIYQLLGRMVEVRLPSRMGSKRLSGIVERVCRDIFDNAVEVTLDGNRHTFDEPSAIVAHGDEIHFLYGDVDWEDDSDEETFEDARSHAYEESLAEFLKKTERRPVVQAVFRVGAMARTPGDRWRSRAALV